MDIIIKSKDNQCITRDKNHQIRLSDLDGGLFCSICGSEVSQEDFIKALSVNMIDNRYIAQFVLKALIFYTDNKWFK